MNEKESLVSPSTSRSKFVTALAWISIVIAGFATFMSLIENIMALLMFPASGVKELLCSSEVTEYMPAVLLFVLSHIHFFFLAYFFGALIMLIVSVGLLKRKNWARISFIAVLALGIISSLAGFFFQGTMVKMMMPKIVQGTDLPGMWDFQPVFLSIRLLTLIIAMVIIIFHGWIIKKLMSKEIRQEFI